jgi:fimbrial chaperone protein
MTGRLALGAALALLASARCADAAMLISPLVVQLSPARPVGEVRITNTGAEAMTIQSAAVRWTQSDGADRYADTAEVLVAPAIATLGPGATQIFRVAARGAPADAERAYRLFLEDVTPAKAGGGVQMRLRNNLPLFLEARNGAGRPVVAPCERPSKGVCLRVENQGDRRFKVTRVILQAGAQRREEPAATTVLAGSWRRLIYDVDLSGPLTVTVETTAGSAASAFPGNDG